VPGQRRGGGDGGNIGLPLARQSDGRCAGGGGEGGSQGAECAHGADVVVIAMISSSKPVEAGMQLPCKPHLVSRRARSDAGVL
jgi:hypothetical protein